VIPITILGPQGQDTRDILVDTGSDDIVFPATVAVQIGIDLSKLSQRHAHGVGSQQPVGLLYAPVILELMDQTEVCRWRAVVGFTHATLRFPLFGIAGGLEHYRTTLDVPDRELIMIAKPSLPVTQDPIP
jgi:hypothetical protein